MTAGSGRRLCRRHRPRALHAGLAHLDLGGAVVCSPAVRGQRLSRRAPGDRRVGRRRQQQRPAGHRHRDDVLAKGMTINGLPILLKRPNASTLDIDQLDIYYEDCVIGGPAPSSSRSVSARSSRRRSAPSSCLRLQAARPIGGSCRWPRPRRASPAPSASAYGRSDGGIRVCLAILSDQPGPFVLAPTWITHRDPGFDAKWVPRPGERWLVSDFMIAARASLPGVARVAGVLHRALLMFESGRLRSGSALGARLLDPLDPLAFCASAGLSNPEPPNSQPSSRSPPKQPRQSILEIRASFRPVQIRASVAPVATARKSCDR